MPEIRLTPVKGGGLGVLQSLHILPQSLGPRNGRPVPGDLCRQTAGTRDELWCRQRVPTRHQHPGPGAGPCPPSHPRKLGSPCHNHVVSVQKVIPLMLTEQRRLGGAENAPANMHAMRSEEAWQRKLCLGICRR